MAHVAITSDLGGNIYTVDHSGAVFHNAHASADRVGGLMHDTPGVQIGGGWAGVRNLAALRVGQSTVFAGVGPTGEVVGASYTPSGTNAAVPLTSPTPIPGAPAAVRFVFGGANANLYFTTLSGALLRLHVTASGAAAQFGTPVELATSGWGHGFALFDNGDGLLFEVTAEGALRYQDLRDPNATPSDRAWQPLAGGWSHFVHVFGAGAGGIYTVATEGGLHLRSYRTSGDGVELSGRSSATIVGPGFFPWTGLVSDVEGYVWPQSVAPGGTVDVHVGVRRSTPPAGAPPTVAGPAFYTRDVRRLRRMKDGVEVVLDEVKAVAIPGEPMQAPSYLVANDYLTRGAGWANSFSITVPDLPADDPAAWRSGVYAARLTDAGGRDFYVPFIVRPAAPRNPFAVLANTNTWNAYNSWGGLGKYNHNYPLPGNLTFLRPHAGLTPDAFWSSADGGQHVFGSTIHSNTCHLLRAELWVLGWLEELVEQFGPKYAYDIYTDQDLHDGVTGIGDGPTPAYKALILNTHPEYWTRVMYDRVKAYRDQGGSIVYLGGNGVYEEVVLHDGGTNMQIFPGVDLSKYPPQTSNEQIRLNCLMRSPYAGRPEHALLGVGFLNCDQGDPEGQPYLLTQDPSDTGANPVLAGVPLKKKDMLGLWSLNISVPDSTHGAAMYHADGWEVDVRGAGTPPQAYAPEAKIAGGNGITPSGEMLCYKTDAGGVVFSASSLSFGASLVVDANLQTIVRNALDLCLTSKPVA